MVKTPRVIYRWLPKTIQFPLPTSVLVLAAFFTVGLGGLYLAPLHRLNTVMIVVLSLLMGLGAAMLYLSTRSRVVSIALFGLGCVLLVALIIVSFAFFYSNLVVTFSHENEGFRFPEDYDARRWRSSIDGRDRLVRHYCLYYSAITYFTVGYGDMHPLSDTIRLLSSLEAMLGYLVSIFIVTVGVSNIVNHRNQ